MLRFQKQRNFFRLRIWRRPEIRNLKSRLICLGYQEPGAQTGTYRYWFQYAGERAPEVIYVKRPPVYVLQEMEPVSAELSDELPVQMEYGDGTGWFDVTEVSCVQSGEGAYEIRDQGPYAAGCVPGDGDTGSWRCSPGAEAGEF